MIFTVKPNRHYANHFFKKRWLFGNELYFAWTIRNCPYEVPDKNGWSKIFGLAALGFRRNSIRLAFKNTESGRVLGLYRRIGEYKHCYRMAGVDALDGKSGECIFRHENNDLWRIDVKVDGVMVLSDIACRLGGKRLPKFILHPYIGGRYTFSKQSIFKIEIV